MTRVLRAPRSVIRFFTRGGTVKSLAVKGGCSSARGGSSPSARTV
ncbi:hypothetical protein ACR6C2_05380 [Streptomyces sp. INA 01156]